MPKNDFFDQVYQVAELIPYGRVTSYGAIAKYMGAVRSARMVGWAMNKCGSWYNYVPAHRVVNRNGLLTGKQHFPGGETMKELLQNEGIIVEDNQIINFKEVFWDPSVELI
nr:MGMT family protein [uncultured Carboxylicivirga sp.]